MEILQDQVLEQISAFIETSGEEGTTIRSIMENIFPDFHESTAEFFSYMLDGKKVELDAVVFPGQNLKVIPQIAGGF